MLDQIPKYEIHRNFFSDDLADRLLEYALANEGSFYETNVRSGSDHSVRVSRGLRNLGAMGPEIDGIVRALVPEFSAGLGISRFDVSRVELELVAHGDGAFYKRHVDTLTGEPDDRGKHDRVVSGVYYFHAMPKGFSGGALRLSPLRAGGELFEDVQPEHNSFVVFPSFAAHEVMRVSCPSGAFRDSRFAINCWMCRAATPARAPARAAGTE